MSLLILLSVLIGIALGRFALPAEAVSFLSSFSPWALALVLFTIGFELASGQEGWQRFLALGWRVLLVPLAVALGSLSGALLVGFFLRLNPAESLSVGAGFGWYSLSGVILSSLGHSYLGAIAFLSNVMRELMAIVIIPWLSNRLGPLVAIAPGGATTMDTTLPLLARYGTHETTMIAFVNGVVLSFFVPILVPFFGGLIR